MELTTRQNNSYIKYIFKKKLSMRRLNQFGTCTGTISKATIIFCYISHQNSFFKFICMENVWHSWYVKFFKAKILTKSYWTKWNPYIKQFKYVSGKEFSEAWRLKEKKKKMTKELYHLDFFLRGAPMTMVNIIHPTFSDWWC